MKKVRIVSATAKNQKEFWQHTLLGQSLSLFPKQTGLEISIFHNNRGTQRRGLSLLYNAFIKTDYENEILLFIHDDVYLHDWHLVQRLNDAIKQFDIVGLAGNANPDFAEPFWRLALNKEKYPRGRQPEEFQSGAVGHVRNNKTYVSIYGLTPRECILMDGLFLAVNTKKVLEKDIQFDPQFEFHLYDLDFCRQCHINGLKLGTWPISVTHGSRGSFNSQAWKTTSKLYLDKWSSDNSAIQVKMQKAIAAYKIGDFREATQLCKLLLSADQNCFAAIIILGVIYAQQGQHVEALELFNRAIQINPNDADVFNNQGNVLKELNRFEEALNSYQQALVIRPLYAEASYQKGDVLRRLKRLKESLVSYDEALAAQPDHINAMVGKADILKAIGEHHAAIEIYRNAINLSPESTVTRFKYLMAYIPVLGINDYDTSSLRARFLDELALLEKWLAEANPADEHDAVGTAQPFYIAYQEQNNKDLLSKYGELCTSAMSSWQKNNNIVPIWARSLSDSKIRLGIVSAHINSHPVWNAIVKGWFQKLDRNRFDLHVFYLGDRKDKETEFAKKSSNKFTEKKKGLKEWIASIFDQNIDVLVYPELGMNPLAVKLASMRLAPIQIATWGHPETTGLSTIDYYLSAEEMEPKEAQSCYTEKLVRLPHLGCYYDPNNTADEFMDMSEFGLNKEEPLLICPGTPFKYVPQHDHVFVNIAQRLGKVKFIFFTNKRSPLLSEKLKQRLTGIFNEAGLDISQYVLFIPQQPKPKFHSIMKQADVFLDSIGFSGFNTAIQAVECNLPLVTYEGLFMRGRFAGAILKRMGMDELVCQDKETYINLAVKIAQNSSYRESIKKKMSKSSPVLYRDTASIQALENFLSRVVSEYWDQTIKLGMTVS